MSQFPWTLIELGSIGTEEETLAFEDELPMQDPVVNYVVHLTQALALLASNAEEPIIGQINAPSRGRNST